MNDELKMVVNAIIEEISRAEERVVKRMDEKFDKLEKKIEELEKRTA